MSAPYGAEKEGVVFYTVNVVAKNGEKWSCEKRFSAFERLHEVLTELYARGGFPAGADLPPKKLKFFTSHVSEHFITERRVLLDSYLKKMARVADVVQSEVWQDFLSSDVLPEWQEPPHEVSKFADDCEITDVNIPQTRMMSDHVLSVHTHEKRERKSAATPASALFSIRRSLFLLSVCLFFACPAIKWMW